MVCVIGLLFHTAAEVQLAVPLLVCSSCGAKSSIHSRLFASTASVKLFILQGCLLQHGSSRSKLMLLIIGGPHHPEEMHSAPSVHASHHHCAHTRDVALGSTRRARAAVPWRVNVWVHQANLSGPTCMRRGVHCSPPAPRLALPPHTAHFAGLPGAGCKAYPLMPNLNEPSCKKCLHQDEKK